MEIHKNKIIAFLWTTTILFFLLRSVLEPLKYFFIASAGLLFISFSYFLLADFRRSKILYFLSITKEFQILGLFLALGILLSSQVEILSIKGLINFLGISLFYLIYSEYKNQIQLRKLITGWIILTLIISTLGLLKWLNLILEFNIGIFSEFYKYGSSLLPEYNFYACYFIISIVIFFYAIYIKAFRTRLIVNQAIIVLYLVNVVLSGSRRGLIVLAVVIIGLTYLTLFKRKSLHRVFYKNLFFFNSLVFSLILIFATLLPFRSKIIHDTTTQTKITGTLYRYSTIIIPNITYELLNDKLWPRSTVYENEKTDWGKYATYNNLVADKVVNKYLDQKNAYWLKFKNHNIENLFYNGDFKYGRIFWGENTPDSIMHEIVSSKFGNTLRVRRSEGNGYWPLVYNGREIVYYEGVTYTFKFKYRILKGSGVPFMIGWWVNEGDGFINSLPYSIQNLEDDWFEYTASYKFKNNQTNLRTFMNSQLANTVVDFSDIELTHNDTLNRPKYLDQKIHFYGNNLLYNSNFENGLEFWNSQAPDSISHELIETKYGKAVRVSRKDGAGYWPLAYQGRDLFYYQDLTYSFRFKFRVIEGGETPFNIGWWVDQEIPNPYNLHKEIFPLGEGWYECITSYQFETNHFGIIPTFMNSQKANTIIDFADIELICNDTTNRSMYADEKIDVIRMLEESRMKQFQGLEKYQVLSERVVRWKYATEIWTKEYTWQKKLFGGGFDYLEKFGQEFYPDEDRIDYPHNPIISSFLYSGLLGGFFYFYFLVLSFVYFWNYRKQHSLLFILYLICFTFVFISTDSHFNVPIFAMLSLVPFITRNIVKQKNI